MALNDQMAFLVLGRTTDPANIPSSPASIAQAEQQQLLWGYTETTWTEAVAAAVDDLLYFILQRIRR
jgi:hypothetical protein